MPLNFVSPGAVAYKGIQDILTQRRAEAQQAFLDRLEQQRIDDERNYRNSSLDVQRATEQHQADLAKAQIEHLQEQITQSKLLQVPRGTPPEKIKDPGLLKDMQNRALFENIPQPDQYPTTESGVLAQGPPAPVAPIFGYGGDKVEKEAATKQARIETLANLAEDPGQRLAILADAAGGHPAASLWEPMAPLTVVGPTGNVVEHPNIRTHGRSIAQLPYPPNSPAGPKSELFDIYDRATGEKLSSAFLTPGDYTTTASEHPEWDIKRQPRGGANSNMSVPPQLGKAVITAVENATKAKADADNAAWGSWRSSSKDAVMLARDADLRTAVGQWLNAAQEKNPKITNDIRKGVISTITSPEFANGKRPKGYKHEDDGSSLAPNEIDLVNRLIDAVAGIQTAPAIPVVH